MVHLVAREVDHHLPSARRVQAAEQKVLPRYRIVARLFQQHLPLRSVTGHVRSPTLS
jgi:hypothetical protein